MMNWLSRILVPLVLVLIISIASPGLLTWAQDAVTPTDIPIEFIGTVEIINPDLVIVDGLSVNISAAVTTIPLQPGELVRVRGRLQPDGSILAESVEVVNENALTPTPLPQVVASSVSVSDSSDINPCGLDADYWTTHPEQWPVTVLHLGGQDYSQQELVNILNAEPSTDASLLLARQLVAAQFNILSGSDASQINQVLVEADLLITNMGGFRGKLPYQVDPISSRGQQMLNWANLLLQYNSAQTVPGCQSPLVPNPQNLPSIVIEGPIETVGEDSLVVNGVNFILDRSNPVLTAVQPGDFVRIEGLLGQNSANIFLIPTNIRIDRNTPAPSAPPPANPPPGNEGMGNEGSGSGMGMGMGG